VGSAFVDDGHGLAQPFTVLVDALDVAARARTSSHAAFSIASS